MLKAIHAQEDCSAARQKAEQVAAKLKEMKLPDAAALVLAGIDEMPYYYAFPSEHWRCLRTNNSLREVRRRNASSRSVPWWEISVDAGPSAFAPRGWLEVGNAALPGHEPPGGSE